MMTTDLISSPHLPAELTDSIIHLLHSEKQALFSCSLVCKSWLPSTRYHLFRYIHLDRIPFLRPGASPSITRNTSRSEELLELLQSALCTIKPFVRSLHVDQRCSSRRMDPKSEDAIARWLEHILAITSLSFPNLDSLCLEAVDFSRLTSNVSAEKGTDCSPLPASAIRVLIEGYLRTKNLMLTGTRFADEGQAMALIASFPLLQSFSWLPGSIWKFGGFVASSIPSTGPSLLSSEFKATLAHLNLQNCTLSTDIINTNMALALASRSSKLSVSSDRHSVSVSQDFPVMNALFEASGSTLRHLNYNAWSWTGCQETPNDENVDSSGHLQMPPVFPSLSRNIELQSLYLERFPFTTAPVKLSIDLCTLFTRQIASSQFRFLTVELDFEYALEYEYNCECEDSSEGGVELEPEDEDEEAYRCKAKMKLLNNLDQYDWTTVDRALSASKFSTTLEKVVFVVRGAPRSSLGDGQLVANGIKEKMAWCDGKGVLSFDFC